MSGNREELEKQAGKIKAQMDEQRALLESMGWKPGMSKEDIEALLDNKSSTGTTEPTDKPEDPRPIFTMPDGIGAEPGHFEPVRKSDGAEDAPEPGGPEKTKATIEELTEKLNKTREKYLKTVTEQSRIKKLGKKLLQGITFNTVKPDFVKAEKSYNEAKRELRNRKIEDKFDEIYDNTSKSTEEQDREWANFKADINLEESAEQSKINDARAEALSERKKALREKALKIGLGTLKIAGSSIQAVQKVDKKLFHRGPLIIDKRGEKPANADDMLRQAQANDDQIDKLEIALKNEELPEEKDRLKDTIKTLKEMSADLKDQAKGKVIYQYRVGQLTRSTALFALGGGFIEGGAGAAMLGVKVARSIGIGLFGTRALAKNQEALETKLHEIELEKEKLNNDFAGNTEEKGYTEAMSKLEKQERRTKIGRNAMKVLIVGLMAGANLASGWAEGKVDNMVHNNADSTSAAPNTESNGNTDNENSENQDFKEQEEKTIREEKPISKPVTPNTPLYNETKINSFNVNISEKGAIATISDLKEKLSQQFPDTNTAPENIKHILNTNSTSLAKEWGMFDPDQAKESAMMLKGSTLSIDEKGNVILHNLGKGDTVLSGEGAQDYSGEMFDSDHQYNSDGTEGTTKLEDGVNINEVPEKLEGGVDIDSAPKAEPYQVYNNSIDINGVPDEYGGPIEDYHPEGTSGAEAVDKNIVHNIKIRGNAFEDQFGRIIRLDGKDVYLENNKIYIDGKLSTELTEDFADEKSKILDNTFAKTFAWSKDGENSPEWLKFQNRNMNQIADPNYKFATDREEKFISKLIKYANKRGVDYHGKTANQLVDLLAIKKLG